MARLARYSFGRIEVDGEEQTKDLIVLPERVVTGWWREQGHALSMKDLREVLDDLPERLIVGTGASGRMRPNPDAIEELRARGIHVEALPTDQAVVRYGELDPRQTAAALHLTC
jgi:hypothetical protein